MLAGTGSVLLRDTRSQRGYICLAVREIRRYVRDLGFKAIRVLPWLGGGERAARCDS